MLPITVAAKAVHQLLRFRDEPINTQLYKRKNSLYDIEVTTRQGRVATVIFNSQTMEGCIQIDDQLHSFRVAEREDILISN